MSTFDLGRFAASITEVPRQNSEPKQLSGRARGFTFFPCVVHMLRQKTQENYKLLPQTLGTIGVIMFHRISFIYVRFTDRSSWQLGIWKWLMPSKIDSFENIEREAPKKREKNHENHAKQLRTAVWSIDSASSQPGTPFNRGPSSKVPKST